MPQSKSASMKIPAHKDVTQSEITRHNEILCSLDLSQNADADAHQKALAVELVEVYENGAKGVWKAKKYSQMANLASKSSLIPETKWKTETAYTGFGWLNDSRLFAVRLANLLNVAKVGTITALSSVLSVLSLIFAVRLVFDISLVVKAIFVPEGEEEKNLTKWERFKAVMAKDNRKYRMANDILWFALNLTTIILSAGMSVAGVVAAKTMLAVGGFAFDSLVEVIKWTDVRRHEQALNDIQAKKAEIENSPEYVSVIAEIVAKNEKLNLLRLALELTQGEAVPADHKVHVTIAALTNDVEELKNSVSYREHAKYAHIEIQLTQKVAQVRRDRIRFIAIIVLACVGMSLSLFPLTLPLGLVIAGAAVAFVAGSLVTGLGERVSNAVTADPKSEVKVEVMPENNAVVEAAKLIAPNADRLLRQRSPSIASVTVVDEDSSVSSPLVSERSVSPSVSPARNGFYSPKHVVRNEEQKEENRYVYAMA
jgi:uncharacterized protein YheU (UPF0270 family)